MLKEDNLDFSFSGLKSAFINTVHNADQIGETLNHEDLAASFQASVVEVLTTKTMHAARQLNVRQLVVAGGVAANQGLREGLATAIKASGMDLDLIMPPLRLCGDNGAMIGAAAHIELQKQQFADLSLNAVPGLDFPYGA